MVYIQRWEELVKLNGPKITLEEVASILRHHDYLAPDDTPSEWAFVSGVYVEGKGWHKDIFLALRTKYRRHARKQRRRDAERYLQILQHRATHIRLNAQFDRQIACPHS